MFFALCIVCVKTMHEQGHVAIIVCAISGLEVRFMGLIFVNNVDLIMAA
jgi:hypothetical protein